MLSRRIQLSSRGAFMESPQTTSLSPDRQGFDGANTASENKRAQLSLSSSMKRQAPLKTAVTAFPRKRIANK